MGFHKQLLVCLAAPILILELGCGTPGAPQPPSLQLPHPVENLSGERKGTRVVLNWTQPTQTTDKQNIRHPGVTRICRGVNEFPMAQCREVVKELGPTEMTSQTTGKGSNSKIVFEDVLPQQAMGPGRYASYAIEVFSDRNRSAGLSNQVRVPLAPTLPPATDIHVTTTPNGPVLHWSGESSAQFGKLASDYAFRYRIYRRLVGQPTYSVIGEIPLDGPRYSFPDSSFDWEKQYEYKIAAVTEIKQSPGQSQSEIEGDDSPIASITVHDTYPPVRPTGLQAVYSGVGQASFIDLSWAPNTESDLAGYIVYRHEEGQPPAALNKEPAKSPAFRDQNVIPGHKYFYSVQAVDVRGNASETSQETSEAVPQPIQ